MSSLQYKIRGSGSPQGRPRVYFCCHPEDFSKYFKEISEEILENQNCAIWYRDDFSAFDYELENDLKQMQLFVIPVTAKFLTMKNSALDIEFKIAIENHIPILPLMQEPGLESLFNLKCGNLQLLNKYSLDTSEISYDEKLKKFLENTLIGDELAEKIRAAFDAYVFLSYRKKDRRYAQELMKLIHKNDFCRDIAIWYDEFLTPGENFNDSIKAALLKSDLFVLTVTPNLVNELNYIITTEYPMAQQENKPVFPVELVHTNKDEFFNKFDGITAPVDAHNDEVFTASLLENIKKLAIKENDSSPEHNFFIGLAYLNGIDVEVDRERAVQLITSAAESGLGEAMEKLFNMYKEGDGVALNYDKAVYWAEKLVAYAEKKYPDEPIKLAICRGNLAQICGEHGEYQRFLELTEQTYHILREHLGEEDRNTLSTLSNLALAYENTGNLQKSLELNKHAYELRKKVFQEESPETLNSMNNLAMIYSALGQHEQALELCQRAYTLLCSTMGEKHRHTLIALSNIALIYNRLEDNEKALELSKKVYSLRKETLGETHPDTLNSLHNLAVDYQEGGDIEQYFELSKQLVRHYTDVLGPNHPDTMLSMANLAHSYGRKGNYEKKLELIEKAYENCIPILGENHPTSFSLRDTLAQACSETGDPIRALVLRKQQYEISKKLYGEHSQDTLVALALLAIAHNEVNEYDIAAQLFEKCLPASYELFGEENAFTSSCLILLAKAYELAGNKQKHIEARENLYLLKVKTLGEHHEDTLDALDNLISICGEEHIEKKLWARQRRYQAYCTIYGEEHPDTLRELSNLAISYGDVGNAQAELELSKKAYKLRKKVLGEEHPQTLISMGNLGYAYDVLGEYEKAVLLRERVYEIHKKTLGEDNPKTIKALERLNKVKAKLNASS